MTLYPCFISLPKIKSKLIENLNVRPEIVKLIKKKTQAKKLLDVGLGKEFLDITLRAIATQAEVNRWDSIKVKSFCTQGNFFL